MRQLARWLVANTDVTVVADITRTHIEDYKVWLAAQPWPDPLRSVNRGPINGARSLALVAGQDVELNPGERRRDWYGRRGCSYRTDPTLSSSGEGRFEEGDGAIDVTDGTVGAGAVVSFGVDDSWFRAHNSAQRTERRQEAAWPSDGSRFPRSRGAR
jgi:hypothetical protein